LEPEEEKLETEMLDKKAIIEKELKELRLKE